MTRYLIPFFVLTLLFSCSSREASSESFVESRNEYILDSERNRQIPTQIYSLTDSTQWNGELVILNCGYGSSPTEYCYITEALAGKGYYVVSIQHEIQTDEMLPNGENMVEARTPNWREGIKSMERVLTFVESEISAISTKKIHLIGHSNGGDMSALFSMERPDRVHSLITLDHRRMPIPLSKEFTVLSFRADKFEEDSGVIPSEEDQKKYGVEIVYLENVDHNYLRDIATKETKKTVLSTIFDFLNAF